MPATKLSEKDVIALVRKEFERKLKKFCDDHGYEDVKDEEPQKEEDDTEDKEKGSLSKPSKPKELDVDTLTPGIRVQHKGSKLAYTVVKLHVGTGEVFLETPEGNVFSVSVEQFEEEYGLD